MQFFRRICCVIGLLSLITFFNVAQAKPLYIEITGGHNVGIPIGVVPFQMDTRVSFSRMEDISKVVRDNLHNSGQFQALPSSRMPFEPHDISEVQYSSWKKLGTEKLVVGRIELQDNGRYDVYFQLIDIYRISDVPMLNLRFRGKSPAEFRALAHHISDLIFEKVTGVKGFFSTRIAYITVDRYLDETVHTLTVADADGHNDKPLISATYPIMSPAWSPDGTKIAFVSFRGNRSSIKVVNVINGQVEHISDSEGINGAPAWSPDGRHLAIVLSKDGAPKLYAMKLSNKKLKRLTHGGAIDTEPFWDPDGQSIVFTSNRGGKPQIYRVTLATGKVKRLTFKGNYNATPSITPDGKQLVMLHRGDEGTFNIAVQNLRNGKVNILTEARLDESPTLAPNGMMVLYGTREAHRHVLGAVTLDGRFKMRLPVQDGNVKEPAWSPFLS